MKTLCTVNFGNLHTEAFSFSLIFNSSFPNLHIFHFLLVSQSWYQISDKIAEGGKIQTQIGPIVRKCPYFIYTHLLFQDQSKTPGKIAK